MRKKILFTLLVAYVLMSCNDAEPVSPTKDQRSQTSTSRTLSSKSSTRDVVSDPNHFITEEGTIASLAASFTPEELYITENNQLYAIDNSSGYGYALNADEPHALAMASTNGFVYAVFDNINFPAQRNLYKIDVITGFYDLLTPGIYWPNTNIMAAVGGYLYAVDGATLWKINATSGARLALGTGNWDGAEAMTALGSYVYIVDDGLLWRVHTSTGAISTFGNGGWSGVPAMAASGSYVFAIDDGAIWRVNVNTAAIEAFSPGSYWNTTVAMTALNGYVYAVDVGQLWKVNGSTGATSLLTPPGYTWSGSYIEMAALQ